MDRKDFLVEIEGDIDEIEGGATLVPKHKRPPGDKIALVKFDGTAITTNGNIVKHNWFKGLQLNQAKYSDIMLTAEEAQQLHAAHTQMKIGASSSTPMVCYGAEVCPMAAKCSFVAIQREIDAKGEERLVVPIGRQCHPAGTIVMTTSGEIEIQDLDPTVHRVWSWHPKQELCRSQKGYSFQIVPQPYSGNMYKLTNEHGEHEVTEGHICIARFNRNAVNKYCIYLMRQGEHWRIGQTTLIKEYNMPKGRIKSLFGPGMRATKEGADDLWILDTCEDVATAHLMEEYYSIQFGVSKASFADSLHKAQSKYDGFFKWATKEQLTAHHDRLKKPRSHYATVLKSLGLSIEFPIWRRSGVFDTGARQYFSLNYAMHIRACNLISDLMDVPVLIKTGNPKSHSKFENHTQWSQTAVTKTQFEGIVFGLDVETYHTYFAGKIATHNCPIEQDLLFEWVARYAEDFGVTDSPGNFTDQRLLLELAECEVLENRMNVVLSTKFQDLTEDKIVAVMQDEYGEREQHVKDIADAMRIKEKLEIKKDKIHKKLVATRFDQYKREAALQETDKNDSANLQAELTARLRKLEDLAKGK